MDPQATKQPISIDEAVALGAADTSFFGEFFFSKTFPLPSPFFHREIDQLFDAPGRLKALRAFRGSAKTSKFRGYLGKRIGFGLSRLALIVSESQGHSMKSLDWLKRQVEKNKLYAQTFALRPGSKWSETEIEIINGQFNTVHRVVALGITGQVRGFNFDDERPDLEIVDDPCDEENTATPEQRQKTEDLIMGALVNGLANPALNPDAQLLFGQTPLNPEDAIQNACRLPGWKALTVSCFDENEESRWGALFPTEFLRQQKMEAFARNQGSIWLREMECKLVSRETSAFKREWLVLDATIPEEGFTILCVDPTPPPKNDEPSSIYRRPLDDAVIMAIKVFKQDVFVCEYRTFKSPKPTQLIDNILQMGVIWRPNWIACETTLFQRVLKFYLEEEMMKTGQFFMVYPVEDKRAKPTRITQALTRRGANRRLHCHPAMTELIEQFAAYPDVPHDDILDALSIGLTSLNPALEGVTIDSSATVSPRPAAGKSLAMPKGWRSAP